MIVFGYSEMSWMCQLFSVWIQTILMLCSCTLHLNELQCLCVDGNDTITPHAKNMPLICGTIVRVRVVNSVYVGINRLFTLGQDGSPAALWAQLLLSSTSSVSYWSLSSPLALSKV